MRLVADRPVARPPLTQQIAGVARHAVGSLHDELVLYPKPGLVSLRDSGAHRDMDASTFMRSLFALRGYFFVMAEGGAATSSVDSLRRLGLRAEARMLAATGGVNTHRGAIFSLGLLAAAAGAQVAADAAPSDAGLRAALGRWPLSPTPVCPGRVRSNGAEVALRYGAAGACGEAAQGFPSVFELGLPALRDALARGAGAPQARLHAFFTLLATVADTNVLHRGGREGLDFVRSAATDFLQRGSVFREGWLARAEALHRRCCERRLSPGGCADLLAAVCFVHRLQTA